MMRIASIDIGTNTILLLIADIDRQGKIHPVHHEQRYPRLGKDVDERKKIPRSAFDRAVEALEEFNAIALHYHTERIIACATSAARDAVNKDDLLRHLRSTTGLTVEVLSGREEALWSYRGVMTGLETSTIPPVVVDIGGGSTEIIYQDSESSLSKSDTDTESSLVRFSLQLGSVRLTERFFMHDPPEEQELQAAAGFIDRELGRLPPFDFSRRILIGVAGTATTLACLDQGLMEFDIGKVSGYSLSRTRIADWFKQLSARTIHEISSLSRTTEGREDILTAGILILNEFMGRFGCETLIVSERGLRYGLVLREWQRSTGL